MRRGIDFYSMSPQEAKTTGATFVCRYLSDDPGKNLSRDEADALSRVGLDIVVDWETTANRARDGLSAGAGDARQALAEAHSCGMPAGRPIYFTVDFDTSNDPSVVAQYFDGALRVMGLKAMGAYGGFATIKFLFDTKRISFGWQTEAWSNGAWDPRAHLRQVEYTAHGYDVDLATATDFGQWSP